MTIERERVLVAQRDPRFVSPSGDSRERPVPCAFCSRPTLALRGPVCLPCGKGGRL